MNNRPIGVFDSGMGGLTVLSKIIEYLPNENYIYYADLDNVPYGLKTNEQIKEYTEKAIKFFIEKDVKAVVIACNTATSIAVEYLRDKYSLPIIGIEPAVKPAVNHRDYKRVMVIATPVTVREEKLKRLIERIDGEECVDLVALPRLVEFAEKEEFDSEKVRKYLEEELKEYNLEEYSELVLGCTHFPYFKKILAKIFGKQVEIIDGSEGVAKRLRDILKEINILGNSKLNIEYYSSGNKINDEKILDKIRRLLDRL